MTGWKARESVSQAGPSGDYRCAQVHKIALSASRDIPFNKLVLSALQRPPHQGRRLHRGARRGHRPAHPAAEPHRAARARRRRRRDRHVRDPGRRPPLPGAGPAGASRSAWPRPRRSPASSAKAASPRRTPWPRTSSARRCIRSTSSARFLRCARRASPRRRSPPPSSSPCGGEAAAAAGVGVAQAARRLRRGRPDPRPADGVHRQRRPRAPGAGVRPASQSYRAKPYAIRRMLTEGAVRAADKRALVHRRTPTRRRAARSCATCSRATTAAGCRTSALVDRLVAERLEREADTVRAEGWKWIEVAPDFAYGHTYRAAPAPRRDGAADRRGGSGAGRAAGEYDRLEETYAQVEELPEEIDQRCRDRNGARHASNDGPWRSIPRRSRAPARSSASTARAR